MSNILNALICFWLPLIASVLLDPRKKVVLRKIENKIGLGGFKHGWLNEDKQIAVLV